ncbi:MAG: ABC transporter ATP-binding protein [Cycloclasticus sp. symbiont of Bathymodiolus heckerae]|nr:MAG: ABC transporter ATP-binding protein [Cycloclasticus sp. symbiont of Bathymodiolus heckerae]
MSTLIEVNNLTRQFGDHCAVNNVSFSLDKGEVLGFLGPNGAGKSTTMKMVCGNLTPTVGEIKINGYDIIEQPKLAKAELGFLPEIPPLYPDLTVDEFLSYCAKLHGLKKAAIKKAVEHGKGKCGLSDMGKRLIANLSKGYQQRIGIAQAILHNPSVIILDEPTVGLDPIQRLEIRSLIRELGKEHSVILSTHILSEVQQSCSRVQIIHHGKLVLNESIGGLSRRMTSSSLLVRFRDQANLNTLRSINNIESVDTLEDQQYRLHHKQGVSVAASVAEMAVNQHWGLLELTPEKHNMEDIFISITQDSDANE